MRLCFVNSQDHPTCHVGFYSSLHCTHNIVFIFFFNCRMLLRCCYLLSYYCWRCCYFHICICQQPNVDCVTEIKSNSICKLRSGYSLVRSPIDEKHGLCGWPAVSLSPPPLSLSLTLMWATVVTVDCFSIVSHIFLVLKWLLT